MARAVENFMKRGRIYQELGVKPVINAMGTQTVHGGCIMEPETTRAMEEASRVMIRMRDLNDRAGEIIAKHTGAEAGLVAAGAAAGMMLQAAACMTGKDPAKIARLPDTEGMNNELIVKWNHNIGFVNAWRAAGAKLAWVGGNHGARQWEIEAAISEKTAALAFVASRWLPGSFDSLDEMVEIGQRRGLPVVVDAAAMLPPVENLCRFIEHGADMVAFSGGKAIRGPQSTGILCGRRELIEAAALNNSPNMAIGRQAKICREEIVGLIVALERYAQHDHVADQHRWRQENQTILDAISDLHGVTCRILQDNWTRPVPELSIQLDDNWQGPSARKVAETLANGSPSIVIGVVRRAGEDLFVNPHGFLEGEAELVAQRLRAAMTAQ